MSSRRRKLLLIGGGGFIGPWISRAAIADGWDVVALARRSGALGDGIHPVCADATNVSSYREWIEGADAVVYNAAHIPKNFTDPIQAAACLATNALAPAAVISELRVRPRPFVLISTGQGYGVHGRTANEEDPMLPASRAPYYLASKLLGDVYTEHFRRAFGIPTAVLRLGSVYGPGMTGGMIHTFLEKSAKGEPIDLEDGGRHSVDLTYVGDVANAVVAVLVRGGTGIFNIGSGRSTTAIAAAQIILSIRKGADSSLRIEPLKAGSPATGFAALDCSRARRDLGYVPTSPEDGLARTVEAWDH